MKDLKPTRGTIFIKKLIEEGEHQRQDFKFAINDARKIARSLSAFANHEGGHLLVGVKDNGVVAGLRNEEDIYVVEEAADIYCRPTPELEFKTYVVDGNAIVLKVDIAPAERRPIVVRENAGIQRAYYRIADENIVAHPLMVKAWRMKESTNGMGMTLGSDEQLLLSLIRERGFIDFETLVKCVHLSRRRVEEIVISLCTIDILDFDFRERQFVLVCK